jgi:hypothetical protein
MPTIGGYRYYTLGKHTCQPSSRDPTRCGFCSGPITPDPRGSASSESPGPTPTDTRLANDEPARARGGDGHQGSLDDPE